jgi:hypothetical protein
MGVNKTLGTVRILHMDDAGAFDAFRKGFETERGDLRFGRFEIDNREAVLGPDFGGMRVHWLYRGAGEVFLPRGFRTKEGDGQRLPAEYGPEPVAPGFLERLAFLEKTLSLVAPSAQAPVRAIVDRRRNGAYVGDLANDLWKLEHASKPWSENPAVVTAIRGLFSVYRDSGYSIKTIDSYERIMEGDQLIVAGREELKVRGRFACLTIEKIDRRVSHVPAVTRLRYLKDSSGGCNFDFDPFRRLPLTWYMNLPGERGDGVNFVNAHVVNIAKETSPTHFHPPKAVGGGAPQNEMYLVLDPAAYNLNTYGRKASLVAYPDLRDLRRYVEYPLRPGHFVFIPAGTGHRGIDVFVNVITIPGFKPHNEYYLDRDVYDASPDPAPANESLFGLKNYQTIEDLL